MRAVLFLSAAFAAVGCGQPPNHEPIAPSLSNSERDAIEVALTASRLAEDRVCLSREVRERMRHGLPGTRLLLRPPPGFEPLVDAQADGVVRLDGHKIANVLLCKSQEMFSPRIAMPAIIGDKALVMLERVTARTAYWMVRRNERWVVVRADRISDDI
jgi:hypothetical protein